MARSGTLVHFRSPTAGPVPRDDRVGRERHHRSGIAADAIVVRRRVIDGVATLAFGLVALGGCGGGASGGAGGTGAAAVAAAPALDASPAAPAATAAAAATPAPAAVTDPTAPATPTNVPVDAPEAHVPVLKVTADAVRVATGSAVSLELSAAGALAALDPVTTQYVLSLPADANGLLVAAGTATGAARVGGVPAGARTVVVRVTATDAAGTVHRQDVRVAAVRASTTGAPEAAALALDYLATELPALYRQDPALAASDNTPADDLATNAGIALGRALFYDTRLSYDGSIACASCHIQTLGFADPSRLSAGVFGRLGTRHSPSLVNLRFQADGRMFWDEHAVSLENQATEPIQNTREMAMTLPTLAARLQSLDFYRPMFAAAFGTPDIDPGRVSRALAQFQRQIVSGASRFDAALASGDVNAALTDDELLGRALFEPVPPDVLQARGLPAVQSLGCSSCHQGPAQAGSLAPSAGLPDPVPAVANVGLDASPIDAGANGRAEFKVPTLRNVARTAPYMHDGRFTTLEQVVRFFASGVIDTPQTSRFLREGNADGAAVRRRTLDEREVRALVAFLNTLTDDALLNDVRFSDPFTSSAR